MKWKKKFPREFWKSCLRPKFRVVEVNVLQVGKTKNGHREKYRDNRRKDRCEESMVRKMWPILLKDTHVETN